MERETSSMDESAIRGCQSWMTLPSMDVIQGWRRRMTDMDGAKDAYQITDRTQWTLPFLFDLFFCNISKFFEIFETIKIASMHQSVPIEASRKQSEVDSSTIPSVWR